MGIEKFLDAGTSHITYEDSLKLIDNHEAFPSRVIPHEFGWWINVLDWAEWDKDMYAQRLKEQGYSPGMLNLLTYAAVNGCWWINLDSDGCYVDSLEVFDW